MKSVRFPRTFKVYAPLLAVFLVLVFVLPKTVQFSYDYKKGAPWMYETLIAQFDFPILKTDSQIQHEKEKIWSNVIPYYRFNRDIKNQVEASISSLISDEHDSLKSGLISLLSQIYDKGVVSHEGSGLIYIQNGNRSVKMPASELYTVQGAKSLIVEYLENNYPAEKIDTLCNLYGLSELIRPNFYYDKATTEKMMTDAVGFISPTSGIVRKGSVVVSEGEIVTAEAEQQLNSYKSEYDRNFGRNDGGLYQWLSSAVIALSLVILLFLAIYYCNHRIFEQQNKYLYLLMIFTLSAVAATSISTSDIASYFMAPFTLISLYLLAFFKKRVVFTVYVISLLPILLFATNGMEIFFIYLVAGVVGMLVFEYFNRGWLQFVTAFIVFVVMVFVWLGFRFGDGPDSMSDYPIILYMAIGAFLSVAGYPLIYLFEKVFKLVSKSKLVDLCDTSNKLLRELADKAPGTFQHSLQVMNLADAAARSIDADVALVRAGALYHDVGKIMNPVCFTENEAPGVNYHDGLSYKESAQEIISHIQNGVELAEKYGLPSIIKDFILTHHGTSCTGYFYNRYLNEGGDPADSAEFFYKGSKPVTKEQVILMLCDGVEAASRSLKDHSAETISELVEKMVSGKVEDGQLSDAEISLSELNIVKDVLKNHIQQMYHVRVAYPKRLTPAKS